MRRIAIALLAVLCCACLDTRGRERAGYSSQVLPADAKVKSVEDDEVLGKRIESNAGVDELVPLRTGFVNGEEALYWDFGAFESSSAEPLWQFRRRGKGGEVEAIDHLDLVDSLPGDSNYSPIRALYRVFVTDAYDGERITTLQALEDALALGLLEEPEAVKSAVNWPVVLAETRLDLGGDAEPLAPVKVYCRGRIATHFQLSGEYPLERGSVSTPDAYVLRRQNEDTVLEEPEWDADLNADEDTNDSNVVFSKNAGEEGYSPLWAQVDVTVAAAYKWGDTKGESDLFDSEEGGPIDGAFVSYAASETLLNRPLREQP